jgi:nucleotide-binding universal stress UspA family protein
MYEKIVVPLDGSKLAEVVLPHLEFFRQGNQSPEVFLVSVTEKVEGRVSQKGDFERGPDQDYAGAPESTRVGHLGMVAPIKGYLVKDVKATMGKMTKTALEYLEKIAETLDKQGFKVTVEVLMGQPAEEIVNYANAQKADVILIASRGKSGFSRWDLGNIAEKIIRATNKVVVLVKPATDFKETKSKRRGVAN